MGSTAALMSGLQSFDSSKAEGTRDGGAGLSTMLGSNAESFHSEDYDPQPAGDWRREMGANGDETDEYESSLFEEREGDDGTPASLAEEDDAQLDRVHLPPAARPPSSAISASSRAASSATRAASTSTAASSVPRPRPASAALYQLGETSADDSHPPDELAELMLDDDDNDSREDRYGRTAARTAAPTSAGAGKKKGDSKGATGGHMTLREQEKVRFRPGVSGSGVMRELTPPPVRAGHRRVQEGEL